MKELEITCQIYNNVLDIKKELERKNFIFKKEFIIDDMYMHNTKTGDFSVTNGKIIDSLVIRYVNENDKKIICKKNISNNIEKSILKVDSIKDAETHLNMLGYRKFLRLAYNNYMYENKQYIAYIQEVKNLGNFLEVEVKNGENQSIKNLIEYVKMLNLKTGEEFNVRKAELLYNELNKNSLK